MTLLVVLFVAGALVGVWLLIPVRPSADDRTSRRTRYDRRRLAGLRRRLVFAAAAGFAAAVLTRWPVPTVGIAALGWFAPEDSSAPRP